MDLAARKRFLSASVDIPAAKIPPGPEKPPSFADAMFVHLMNALNMTEPSQRVPLLDEIIFRVQWLKKFQLNSNQNESKTWSSEKSLPRQEHKPLDQQQMKRSIQNEQDMLQNMSKLLNIPVPPPPPPQILTPQPTPTIRVSEHQKKSPIPIHTSPVAPPPPASKSISKKPDPPVPQPQPQTQLIAAPNPFTKSAEDFIFDLQQKQRKLLAYISSAHNGNVSDCILHDYLRHPIVKLSENGVVREEINPFYHLMGPSVTQGGSSMPVLPKIIPQPTVPISDTSKSTTPIPTPPILVAQVDLKQRSEVNTESKNEENSPLEKVSPPPTLPPQLPLQVSLQVPPESSKAFKVPSARPCNQWSVFSMALPLKLQCKCHPMACKHN